MAFSLADAVIYFRGDRSQLDSDLDRSERDVRSSSGRMGDALKGALVSGAAIAGAALVGVGIQAVSMASDIENATAKARTQLGLSTDVAQEFEDVMRSIYRNNFGESFEDISQALAITRQQFRGIGVDLPNEELQAVTENAFAVRDAFDEDLTSTVNSVTALMDNFGITSDQAFDVITAGFQRGLNSSGDFLDSIGEYSNQFANGGATVEEFFSILETGLQSGVLGTDKIADAFKEFNIRIVDNSKTTRDALDGIGISYDELAQGFRDGSITSVDAMQRVITKINEIEDPIERNTIGVALFGTQWEDITADVLLAIDSQKTALSDLEGTADSLGDQYDTTSARWQDASRDMRDALVPIGEALMDMGVRIMPFVVDYIENTLTPATKRWADSIATAFERFNEGRKTFENAPSAEEMFFGGRIPEQVFRGEPRVELLPQNLGANPFRLPQNPDAQSPFASPNVNINVDARGFDNPFDLARATGISVIEAMRQLGMQP